jgi:two-component system sensor histidine kinase TctE
VEPSGESIAEEPVDFAAVAGAHVDEWLQRADARRIDLGFELASARVHGHPALLGELATNLIENALAYTPAGGTVTVRTGEDAKCAFFEVEDDGPGIPPAERPRVFERFYRIQGSPPGGSGLGLAIVREIAQRHAAVVDIDTGAGGRGTVVRTRFPVDAALHAAAAPQSPSRMSRRVSPL